MPAERFYLSSPLFEPDDLLLLEKDEFHHLAHVMRLKKGEEIELINGQGSLAVARIESIEKHKAFLRIESSTLHEPPCYGLILAQALPRFSRLEYVVEKSVELGATELWLFPGTLSEKKDLSPTQIERIDHLILSAMKQCGSLYQPKVRFLPPLLSWKREEVPCPAFFGDTHSESPFFTEKLLNFTGPSLLIAIGPEKGFHEKEEAHLRNVLSFDGVQLHTHILRTETASLFSLSLASAFLLKNRLKK